MLKKSKISIIIISTLVLLVSFIGIYFIIFPPNDDVLASVKQEVERLQIENENKIQYINELTKQLQNLEKKYQAERRNRIEVVEKKYTDLDPDGIVSALNAITDRARQRRLETISSRGDPD